LQPYNLAKAELLMIINHRPTTLNTLSFIVEELETRYDSPETQQEILRIIAEVLGTPDEAAERKAMEDSKEAEQGRVTRSAGQVDVHGASSGST
jgi:hypothetical protein